MSREFLLCSPSHRPVIGFGTKSGSVVRALVRSWGSNGSSTRLLASVVFRRSLCRLSDAGPSICRLVAVGRYLKPYTKVAFTPVGQCNPLI